MSSPLPSLLDLRPVLGKLRRHASWPTRVRVVYQRDASECAPTCLAMVLEAMGVPEARVTLRRLCRVSAEGTDLATLANVARQLGLTARGLQAHHAAFVRLPTPLIAHVDGNHFLVVERVCAGMVDFVDPAYGRDSLPLEAFAERATGVFLHVQATDVGSVGAALNALAVAPRERRRILWEEFYRPAAVAAAPVLWAALGLSALLEVLAIASPVLSQRVVDAALVASAKLRSEWVGAALVLAFFAQWAATAGRNRLLLRAVSSWVLAMYVRVFQRLVSLPPRSLESYQREDLLAALETRQSIAQVFSPGFFQGAFDVVQLLGYLGLLLAYAWEPAIAACALTLLSVVLIARRRRRETLLRRREHYARVRAAATAADTIDGATTTKLLGAEASRAAVWTRRLREALDGATASGAAAAASQSEQYALHLASNLVVLFGGILLLSTHRLTTGQYIAMLTMATAVVARTQSVGSMWAAATGVAAELERLHDVVVHPPEISGPSTLGPPDHCARVGTVEVRLANVSYAYEATQVLRNVSLSLPKIGRVAIVGRNGSGKSTLLKVLAGLYRDYEGRVTFGEIDAAALSVQEWRGMVGVIPQDVYLFEGSLRSNLLLARPEASTAELWRAAEMADLPPLIRRGSGGLEFPIAAGGRNLSGGERLRVAFARLFIAAPPIILLDEASSALDPVAERELLNRLHTAFADRLVVSVAHRLNTIKGADLVVVMSDGRVVAHGQHEELLGHDPHYTELVRAFYGS